MEDFGSLAGSVGGEVLAVADVGLKDVEEPSESLDVVLVLLAFDDNLLFHRTAISAMCQTLMAMRAMLPSSSGR